MKPKQTPATRRATPIRPVETISPDKLARAVGGGEPVPYMRCTYGLGMREQFPGTDHVVGPKGEVAIKSPISGKYYPAYMGDMRGQDGSVHRVPAMDSLDMGYGTPQEAWARPGVVRLQRQ